MMKSKAKRAREETETALQAVHTAADPTTPVGQNGGPPLDPEFDLVTETEAAATLHWAVSTLQKDRVTTVRVPFVKLGKRVLYRRSDLRAFVASNVRRSAAVA